MARWAGLRRGARTVGSAAIRAATPTSNRSTNSVARGSVRSALSAAANAGNTDALDYVEVKTGATWAKDAWSIRITNYWSPDFANAFGDSDAIEGQLGYTFSKKLFNFFTPTISGGAGYQALDKIANDYTYWNAGLTLGFMDHWSVDVRYWDTSYSTTECGTYVFAATGFRSPNCDATVVGTLKAVF